MDPAATMVDWRLVDRDSGAPASVVRFRNGVLQVADAGGEVGDTHDEPTPSELPPNHQIVIYEFPTAWTGSGNAGARDVGIGGFADVTAFVDAATEFANFDGVDFADIGSLWRYARSVDDALTRSAAGGGPSTRRASS